MKTVHSIFQLSFPFFLFPDPLDSGLFLLLSLYISPSLSHSPSNIHFILFYYSLFNLLSILPLSLFLLFFLSFPPYLPCSLTQPLPLFPKKGPSNFLARTLLFIIFSPSPFCTSRLSFHSNFLFFFILHIYTH